MKITRPRGGGKQLLLLCLAAVLVVVGTSLSPPFHGSVYSDGGGWISMPSMHVRTETVSSIISSIYSQGGDQTWSSSFHPSRRFNGIGGSSRNVVPAAGVA